ncbi:MAG: heparinase II/III family protein [Prolixibacteraceae bacterium]|nr:heparinase II/III family protein [Prolixibacteraceae bacterium]
MTVVWLKKHLKKQTPRLVLNRRIDRTLKQKLKTDPVVQTFSHTLKSDADHILEQPLLQRVMVGRRMSNGQIRERLSTLGMVYHISKEKKYLDRINQEVLAVCAFPDWNPSHFLDVSGTAISVALAIDWAGNNLPASTVETAKQALIDKGLLPSFNDEYNWWVKSPHNWNQVCEAGMIAAAIVVAEKNPELAVKTISRALDNMGLALEVYGPDGVYPEGATYWGYGTMHTVITISMLNSAFGTDFGISDYPGFLKGADFVPIVTAPSGEFYNFYDCGSNLTENNRGFGYPTVAMFNRSAIAVNLMWFAAHTGNAFYYDKSYFTDTSENRRRQYFDGPALVWLSQFEPVKTEQLPKIWKGEGINPLVVFRGGKNDPNMYYLGAKGGKASNNHGNMDAGSFIFELDGVRWSIDLGNQNYNTLEQAGFDLWNESQNSERWTLLTKGNIGHSTLTVNNERQKVDGFSSIKYFDDGSDGRTPQATFDLSEVYRGLLQKAERTFIKNSPRSLIIQDELVLNENTKSVTWQMMTTADVEIVDGGAVLRQNGKVLRLENLSHPDFSVSVISLYPAPLKLDVQVPNLKRIEIRIPAWTIDGGKTKIKVRLTGN